MANLEIKVFYPKGVRLTLKNVTFKKAIETVFHEENIIENQPLKMVFQSTGKTLFIDMPAFNAFLKGDINQKELLELTECDGLYRNKEAFEIKHRQIDAGSLWKASKKELVLIDDDDYVVTKLDLDVFEIVEPN